MDKNKRIEELEQAIFYLSMKDRWTWEDIKKDMDMRRELAELQK